jgi:hypothetical protein
MFLEVVKPLAHSFVDVIKLNTTMISQMKFSWEGIILFMICIEIHISYLDKNKLIM